MVTCTNSRAARSPPARPVNDCGSPVCGMLRRYLDGGGKVVWVGPPPGIFLLETPSGQLAEDHFASYLAAEDAGR